jgi:hypothetical protein
VACLFRTKLFDELGKYNLCVGQRWRQWGKVGGITCKRFGGPWTWLPMGLAYVRGLSLDTIMRKLFCNPVSSIQRAAFRGLQVHARLN